MQDPENTGKTGSGIRLESGWKVACHLAGCFSWSGTLGCRIEESERGLLAVLDSDLDGAFGGVEEPAGLAVCREALLQRFP